jgi:hypothetical protein
MEIFLEIFIVAEMACVCASLVAALAYPCVCLAQDAATGQTGSWQPPPRNIQYLGC